MSTKYKPLPSEIAQYLKPTTMTNPVSVRMPVELKESLTSIAKQNNTTVTALILSILMAFNESQIDNN